MKMLRLERTMDYQNSRQEHLSLLSRRENAGKENPISWDTPFSRESAKSKLQKVSMLLCKEQSQFMLHRAWPILDQSVMTQKHTYSFLKKKGSTETNEVAAGQMLKFCQAKSEEIQPCKAPQHARKQARSQSMVWAYATSGTELSNSYFPEATSLMANSSSHFSGLGPTGQTVLSHIQVSPNSLLEMVKVKKVTQGNESLESDMN